MVVGRVEKGMGGRGANRGLEEEEEEEEDGVRGE